MVPGIYLAALLWTGRAGSVSFSEGSVEDGAGFGNGLGDGPGDKTLTVSSMVKSCLAGVDPFLPCINERAMAAIEQTESMDTVRLDADLEIARQRGAEAAAAPRGTYSFGKVGRILMYNKIDNRHPRPKWSYASSDFSKNFSKCRISYAYNLLLLKFPTSLLNEIRPVRNGSMLCVRSKIYTTPYTRKRNFLKVTRY